jgi:hypothetical protein
MLRFLHVIDNKSEPNEMDENYNCYEKWELHLISQLMCMVNIEVKLNIQELIKLLCSSKAELTLKSIYQINIHILKEKSIRYVYNMKSI